MNRFTGTAPVAPCLQLEDTEMHVWFERDRAHVDLRNKIDDETIIEWWDDDVGQAVEDGFLNPRDWHRSAYDYALSLGIFHD